MPRHGTIGTDDHARSRLKELTEQLAELKKLEQKARRQKTKSCMNAFVKAVGKEIMLLTGGNKTAAIRWFTFKKVAAETSASHCDDILCPWFASLQPCDTVLAADADITGAAKRHRTAARKFVGEFALHGWVESQNMNLGIAPLTSIVSQCGLAAAGAASDGKPPCTSLKLRSKYQWLRRWRDRWGVALGRVTAREQLSTKEMQNKAGILASPRVHFRLYLGCVCVHVLSFFLRPSGGRVFVATRLIHTVCMFKKRLQKKVEIGRSSFTGGSCLEMGELVGSGRSPKEAHRSHQLR